MRVLIFSSHSLQNKQTTEFSNFFSFNSKRISLLGAKSWCANSVCVMVAFCVCTCVSGCFEIQMWNAEGNGCKPHRSSSLPSLCQVKNSCSITPSNMNFQFIRSHLKFQVTAHAFPNTSGYIVAIYFWNASTDVTSLQICFSASRKRKEDSDKHCHHINVTIMKQGYSI